MLKIASYNWGDPVNDIIILIELELNVMKIVALSNTVKLMFSFLIRCPCDDWFIFGSKSWRVYGRNAEEVKSAILAAHPEMTVVLNPEKPRRNSFEITLLGGGKGEDVRNRKHCFLASTRDDLDGTEIISFLLTNEERKASPT